MRAQLLSRAGGALLAADEAHAAHQHVDADGFFRNGLRAAGDKKCLGGVAALNVVVECDHGFCCFGVAV